LNSLFQNIVVGLAAADADSEIVRYAKNLVERLSPKTIHFAHVLPQVGSSFEVAQETIRRAVGEHFGDAGGARVVTQIIRGQRIDALLEYAAVNENDLMLVGHRKQTSGRRSLARRLAMKAPCSVLMAPEGAAPAFDRIVVPTDFSEPSADALSVATALASAAAAQEIFALHVYFDESTTTYEGFDEVIRGREQIAFNRFVAPIDRHGVTVRPIFEDASNVPHAINRIVRAEGINLIVMGTRGRSRSAAVLLGSETEHTIIESEIPVLAVKHFGARLNLLQTLFDKKFRQKGGIWYGSI
jgi:nucleotide-binding universal stress UspA family protein